MPPVLTQTRFPSDPFPARLPACLPACLPAFAIMIGHSKGARECSRIGGRQTAWEENMSGSMGSVQATATNPATATGCTTANQPQLLLRSALRC